MEESPWLGTSQDGTKCMSLASFRRVQLPRWRGASFDLVGSFGQASVQAGLSTLVAFQRASLRSSTFALIGARASWLGAFFTALGQEELFGKVASRQAPLYGHGLGVFIVYSKFIDLWQGGLDGRCDHSRKKKKKKTMPRG